MKILKKIWYGIIAALTAVCVGILICALSPSLTGVLAERVQKLSAAEGGMGATPGVEAPEYGPDDSVGVYERPEELPENLPELVAGLTGYRPVTSESQVISQEEADNLGSILAVGETGEGLSFPEVYYPYYAMLDDTLKRVYCQVYANASALNKSFTPVAALSVEQAKTVVEAVYNDHPDLFWLEAEFSCKYLGTGICVEITLEYNEAADDIEAAKQLFTSRAEEILAAAGGLQSSYEKEQYFHDTLVANVEYDLSARMNQSAYSALVLGRTVCAGYARAFQYLMQQAGIPCYYCTGYAGEDHAWNIVKQGSFYYNVDVTWDDTEPSTYDYYNKSDNAFASTHVRTDLAVYLPPCRESAQSGESEGESSGIVDSYINPNPIEPMRWQEPEIEEEEEEIDEETRRQENLNKAGITEAEVLDTLEKYYDDCEEGLKIVGTGSGQFTNVIPESLWSMIEYAYSTGDYRRGYVDDALKEMKAEQFLIQLQVQRLGGGYCRLYHNIYVE
ncbi:MAG: hypothetical protein NC432_00515 [Roseburia sp.]|nr:hypothetical protein [Roseburia sp.]MCM1098331.1 hypothetical protein [Ruminococcus flavefaciens]